MMILVFVGTVAMIFGIFWWGVHATKPRLMSVDMRRADFAESIAADEYLSEPPRRAFDASTRTHV
jgi:hypothetical protein